MPASLACTFEKETYLRPNDTNLYKGQKKLSLKYHASAAMSNLIT
jgi:hypothetical protein